MAGPSTIVKKHYEAAMAEAADIGIPADTMARTTLSFVMMTLREHNTTAQIRDELVYVIDNLDPNEEYVFMRP